MEVYIRRPRAIILDVEGTTISCRYLSDILFPYIKNNLKRFLYENWGKKELMHTIDRIRIKTLEEQKSGSKIPIISSESESPDVVIRSVVANVLWQMDEKKKNTPLKELQILAWIYGYENKEIETKIFTDVRDALVLWKTKYNINIYIYSGGMVTAQQLLFSRSNLGNLLHLIDDYFDLQLGPKTSSTSYHKIASIIQEDESDILFVTDSPKEAQAAMEARCQAIIIQRPGNKALTSQDLRNFQVVNSLMDIKFG